MSEVRENPNPKYVSPVTRRVASTCGLILDFKAGVPTPVPPLMQKEVLQYGIYPVDGDVKIDEPEKPVVEPRGNEREEKIKGAFVILTETNDAKDFTAGGLPSLGSVAKLTGFKITSTERNQLWQEFRETS